MTAPASFEIEPVGPYSLSASARFLEGFAPAVQGASPEGHLHLAFVPDGADATAGICLQESPTGSVRGELYGAGHAEGIRDQVARILSLDSDAGGFAEVGVRDPRVGRLQALHPGLRPVCFHSPYEAAAWAIIGQRVRIVQAARVKEAMSRELGEAVEMHGDERRAFPPPSRLRRLQGFAGLTERKAGYLRALGEAAEETDLLDAARLRSVPAEQALAELEELPGIGPFSGELILLRGAGEPDRAPVAEPRLRRAVSRAYRLDAEPGEEELARLAEAWRPFRTWVAFLLRVSLEEETGEIVASSQRR